MLGPEVGQRRAASTPGYWSEPRGDPGGLLYVALGDSTAQGIGASSPDKGYVGLLAERLRQRTGRPVEVVNLSVSGATVADVVADQLPLLQGQEPDLVTVAVGGNDVRRYDRERFDSDVDSLVAGPPPGTFVADVPLLHARALADRLRRGGGQRPREGGRRRARGRAPERAAAGRGAEGDAHPDLGRLLPPQRPRVPGV